MKVIKLGIEDLDNANEDFIRRSKQFLKQVEENKSITSKELSRMNSFFKSYLESYFVREEKIQLEVNYPYYGEHQRVHQILKRRILDLISNLDKQEVKAEVVYDVYVEILNSFKAHVYYIDQDIKKHMMN